LSVCRSSSLTGQNQALTATKSTPRSGRSLLFANGAALAERHKSDAAAFALTIQATVVKAIQGGARTTRQVADSLNSAGLQPRQGSHWYSASVAWFLKRLAGARDES
jgi:hypothetical protein